MGIPTLWGQLSGIPSTQSSAAIARASSPTDGTAERRAMPGVCDAPEPVLVLVLVLVPVAESEPGGGVVEVSLGGGLVAV